MTQPRQDQERDDASRAVHVPWTFPLPVLGARVRTPRGEGVVVTVGHADGPGGPYGPFINVLLDEQERDEAVAPAYVWVHGDDTSRTTWSACLNDPRNGVCATVVDLFDDGRVAGIETMGGPATPRELLAVIRHMRWHTAVQPEAEYRAILDVVSAARAWALVESWRNSQTEHSSIWLEANRGASRVLAASVDALPPQAPEDAPETAAERPALAKGGVIADGHPPFLVGERGPETWTAGRLLGQTVHPGPFFVREGTEPGAVVHEYVSTACQHDHHDYCARDWGQFGPKTPLRCKWCPAMCLCQCHAEVTDVT